MNEPHEIALLDAAAAAAGDEAAVKAGATWAGLMERAAGHLARAVVDAAGHGYGLKVAVLAGKGNNGGDGWAAARRLRDFGATSRVVAVSGLDADMSDEAGANRDRWLSSAGRASGPEGVDATLDWCDVAVDCLLGTGATGAPRGTIGEVVPALNRARDAGTVVVACDVPTGVQADDGVVAGDAVKADRTVTLGGMKRGLVLHPGATYAGRVTVGELGAAYEPPAQDWRALTALGARPADLAPDADKRARGAVLVVAGSLGMAGAAILCARGALAAGAGLVTVAVPRSIQDVVAGALPPALTLGLDEDDAGALAASAAEALAERAAECDAVVAGPGLTHRPGIRTIVDALKSAAPRLVLDADAVNVYRGEGGDLADHVGDLVLTPQHRELARIADSADDGQDALARRHEIAPRLAAQLDVTVVAKGPATIVAAADGRVWVTPTGGPQLGAGGTGDVLAGATAATLATGADSAAGAARACWWGGLAGHLAGMGAADRSSSADMASALPHALALTRQLSERRPRWPFDAPGWQHDRDAIARAPCIRHDIGRVTVGHDIGGVTAGHDIGRVTAREHGAMS